MYTISELVEQDVLKLKQENHSEYTIITYHNFYKKFVSFSSERGISSFSEELGTEFLELSKKEHPNYSHNKIVFMDRAMKRLACQNDGIPWTPNYHSPRPFQDSCFNEVRDEYYNYLQQKCDTEYCRSQLHNVSKFLCCLENCGLTKIEDISPTYILAVFTEKSFSRRHCRDVCAFLKYANIYGIVNEDYSKSVPMPIRHQPVPSVYSAEEIELMLSTIDKSKKTGVRNYAIILIVARLGLRASEVAGLKFENIKTTTIDFRQKKVRKDHSLPLLPEIKEAIDDYTNNARPSSDSDFIFLDRGGYYPMSAKNVGTIVRTAYKRAGVDPKGRRSGSHTLRSSLATELIDEGNSYFTVQKILNHADIQNTKSYVKGNPKQLKQCAIPVPLPVGNFKALLQ